MLISVVRFILLLLLFLLVYILFILFYFGLLLLFGGREVLVCFVIIFNLQCIYIYK